MCGHSIEMSSLSSNFTYFRFDEREGVLLAWKILKNVCLALDNCILLNVNVFFLVYEHDSVGVLMNILWRWGRVNELGIWMWKRAIGELLCYLVLKW